MGCLIKGVVGDCAIGIGWINRVGILLIIGERNGDMKGIAIRVVKSG